MNFFVYFVASTSTSASASKGASAVWRYFEKKGETGLDGKKITTAICKVCHKKFTLSRSNTTNLWSHLETNHMTEYIKCAPHKLQAAPKRKSAAASSANGGTFMDIRDAFNRSKPYPSNSREHKVRTDAVLDYIISDGRPLSTIDSVKFQKMLSVFDVRYSSPSRRTITADVIPARFLKMKAETRTVIHKARHMLSQTLKIPLFSFTTDLWSSVTMDPYISLTIHFIDNAFIMKAIVLENRYIPDSHTGINLSETLLQILEEWGLCKGEVASITTDSAANMIKMGTEANILRIPCFGHLLHNGVSKALKHADITAVTARVKRIVAHFHQSHRRQTALEVELESANKPALHLIGSCPTRWGSTFDMYNRVLQQLPEIKRVLVTDSPQLIPSPEETTIIHTVCEALSDYGSLTDALSGEKAPTASTILPLVERVDRMRYAKLKHTTGIEMRNSIYDYLNSKYECMEKKNMV